MSKHVRKGEPMSQGRTHGPEMVTADRPAGGAELPDALPIGDRPEDAQPVGKYWIVIVLWTIAFAVLIGFEIISAIFKR
jgi:hypothetical protein